MHFSSFPELRDAIDLWNGRETSAKLLQFDLIFFKDIFT